MVAILSRRKLIELRMPPATFNITRFRYSLLVQETPPREELTSICNELFSLHNLF